MIQQRLVKLSLGNGYLYGFSILMVIYEGSRMILRKVKDKK
jgi:hypothetical protein